MLVHLPGEDLTPGLTPELSAALAEARSAPLVPLPGQPEGVPWPTDEWPEGSAPDGAGRALEELLDELLADVDAYGTTYAALVVHGGRLVAERYGGEIEHWDGPSETVGPETRLLSWSMAKSMLHAAVGILVGDGRLAVDAPAPVAAWQSADDPRHAITVQDLLEMRDGLDFTEAYVIGEPSHVIEMLFGDGKQDMAGFAAARPAAVPPGVRFGYSSGTSNILSGIVASVVGRGESYLSFLHQRLFGPIGARSVTPGLDGAGTWAASSFVHATARDYARFGYLYLRNGVWDDHRLLPAGWVDQGRRPRSIDAEDGALYGAHWWVVGDSQGTFRASGYEGQSILVCPGLDLVVVRLGKSAEELGTNLKQWRLRMVEAFA